MIPMRQYFLRKTTNSLLEEGLSQACCNHYKINSFAKQFFELNKFTDFAFYKRLLLHLNNSASADQFQNLYK